MFGLGSQEVILIILILMMFAIPLLWIITLIDILKSDFEGYNKIIWILVAAFIPLIGSVLYLMIGRKQKK
jgi:hypothetical protein